jgi:hypothetical protein
MNIMNECWAEFVEFCFYLSFLLPFPSLRRLWMFSRLFSFYFYFYFYSHKIRRSRVYRWVCYYPLFTLFLGVFLFCAINLNLEMICLIKKIWVFLFLCSWIDFGVWNNGFFDYFFWRNWVTRLIFEQTLFLGVSSFVFSTWFWGFQSWFFEFFLRKREPGYRN